ncbi:hypothetical protein FB565_006459 [Actinoplanes lutulentus]|uniref:DUF4034 domain-containing protein n=1 Tax=Actinoplanes lutulentus TaxID=1287878 RepID=A0A327ZA63_9ACTN|nr:hypothetical protein [Actinoplanes lutulentus]MBB2946691.1 hypothetical protein [Actinoplanes lutulentus]RAK35584.1 hypothetical protein B0I29_10957 [Actinoplanes lutulentus]
MVPPHDVVLDLATAYPDIAVVRAALARRDWQACRRVLDAAAPDSRTGLIRAGADEDGLDDFLRDILRRDPSDGAASAMLGTRLIGIGWKVRTSAQAKDVSAEQFKVFHEWLGHAEEVLIEGAARNPRDPAIWTVRLTSALGLSLGLAEARRRYDRMAAADPHHLPGQRSLLQQLCPKWGGSWEELHTFARDAMRAVPTGTAHGILVAEAHTEHMISIWLAGGDDAALRDYLRAPAVRAELFEAAQRSIGDPAFRHTYGWLEAASTFAFLFWKMQEKSAAAWALRLLGDLGTAYPWNIHKSVPDVIRAARTWASGEP